MKNQQQTLKESRLTSSSILIKDNKKHIEILCYQYNVAIHVCMNQKCNHKAFICEDQDCPCQQNHKKCLKLKTQSLINNLHQKKVSILDTFEIFITNKIQTIIDQLSDFREKTINQMKEKFQLFGLNNTEKQFLKNLENGKFEKVSGSKIWEIIHFQQKKQDIITIVNETYQAFQDILEKSKLNLNQNLKNISATIQKCNDKVLKLFDQKIPIKQPIIINQKQFINQSNFSNFTSKVVKTLQQYKTLRDFFGSKVFKSAKLLYRASQNNFQTKKFHQKCDNISYTLILLETQYGKKIGGYTPIKWDSPGRGNYVKDQTMSSFLFSLTHYDKFHLNAKESALFHYPAENNNGIAFGAGHDLCICDNANKTPSRANINSSYKNQKYRFNNAQSWQRFTGNRNSFNFLIKQWECWSLSFW